LRVSSATGAHDRPIANADSTGKKRESVNLSAMPADGTALPMPSEDFGMSRFKGRF
jgi:hypothetical protein